MYVGSARGPYQQGFQKAEEGKEEQDEEGQRYRQGKGWNWQKGECSEFFFTKLPHFYLSRTQMDLVYVDILRFSHTLIKLSLN